MPITILIITAIKIYIVVEGWLLDDAGEALRYKKNIQFQIPDLRFTEGQTNCFKKCSEKLFTISKLFENIFINYFFQAAIILDPRPWYPFPKDLLLRRSSARFRWWFWRCFGFNWLEILLGNRWYHHFWKCLKSGDELEWSQVLTTQKQLWYLRIHAGCSLN